MEELIEVLEPNGNPTGRSKPKSRIHADGDWHRAAHVWVVTPEGLVLLQRRALVKENHPGLWDVSAAGHLSAGETTRQAAVRELQEEIGVHALAGDLLEIATLRESWVLNGGMYLDNEIHSVFVLIHEVEPASLVLQPEEVMDAQLITPSRLREMMTARDASLVPHWAEYAILLAHLGRHGAC